MTAAPPLLDYEIATLIWLAGYGDKTEGPGRVRDLACESLLAAGYIDERDDLTEAGWVEIERLGLERRKLLPQAKSFAD